MRYCGREFTAVEVKEINQLINANPKANRSALSRYVCELLDWYRHDGRLKDMSCRVAMLRMHEDGLLQLPPPGNGNNNGKPYTRRSNQTAPKLSPVVISPEKFSDLQLFPVLKKDDSHLWNEYIQRYHYLGYAPIPGDQIRYIAKFHQQEVAMLSFRAAVWKTAPRDQFIGWNIQQRKRNLHLIINNARFLILPWVKSPNLASRLLSMISKRVKDDWQQLYGYSPVLMETFVETPRFLGTCYKAANWQYLGKMKGLGRLAKTNIPKLPIKEIYIYPLKKRFRNKLCC